MNGGDSLEVLAMDSQQVMGYRARLAIKIKSLTKTQDKDEAKLQAGQVLQVLVQALSH